MGTITGTIGQVRGRGEGFDLPCVCCYSLGDVKIPQNYVTRARTTRPMLMDASKDIVTTILGASVGLAGLLLVFSGFLFAQAEAFPRATTDNATINKFKKAGLAPVSWTGS